MINHSTNSFFRLSTRTIRFRDPSFIINCLTKNLWISGVSWRKSSNPNIKIARMEKYPTVSARNTVVTRAHHIRVDYCCINSCVPIINHCNCIIKWNIQITRLTIFVISSKPGHIDCHCISTVRNTPSDPFLDIIYCRSHTKFILDSNVSIWILCFIIHKIWIRNDSWANASYKLICLTSHVVLPALIVIGLIINVSIIKLSHKITSTI